MMPQATTLSDKVNWHIKATPRNKPQKKLLAIMTLRKRYLVSIGVVWMTINIYLHEDRIPGENWSFTNRKFLPAVKVVVLSYHRSGSSFLGELLSSCEFCSYFFEPLFYEEKLRLTPSANAYRNSLQGIFSCNKTLLDELRTNKEQWIVRKFGETTGIFSDSRYDIVNLCQIDELQVIKTIRLRVPDVLPLWKQIPTLKVVHLVRDPRGVLHSIQKMTNVWSAEEQSITQHCKDTYRDLVAAADLPTDRYFMVRYEDLIRDTLNTTKAIYAFLGRSITPAVESHIRHHTQAETNPEHSKVAAAYFSTFRNSSFQIDQWKTKMAPTMIKMVECECYNVMKQLGYEPMALTASHIFKKNKTTNPEIEL